MEDTKIFQREDFGELRVVHVQGEPWFVAADVCRALEIGETHVALRRLCDEEKGRFSTPTPGGTQEMSIINESGLYTLILGSRKPEAKAFKRWITQEVIPSIRRHGAYLTPEKVEEVLSDPDTIIRLASQLKQEREAKKRLENQMALDEPKVRLANSITAGTGTIMISDLAKILQQNGFKIGRDRLFEKLRNEGFLCSSIGQRNRPSQRSMDLGLFEVSESVWKDSDGNDHNSFTTKVTGKGQEYFLNHFIHRHNG